MELFLPCSQCRSNRGIVRRGSGKGFRSAPTAELLRDLPTAQESQELPVLLWSDQDRYPREILRCRPYQGGSADVDELQQRRQIPTALPHLLEGIETDHHQVNWFDTQALQLRQVLRLVPPSQNRRMQKRVERLDTPVQNRREAC